MRNIKIEWLRVFFMWIIVMLHVLSYGYGFTSTTSFVQDDFDGRLVPSLFGLSKLGVTGFIFISGYYSIKLKISKVISLWVPTTFYSFVGGLTLLIIGVGRLKYIVDSPISLFDGWWFIQSYLILMLISPFLNYGVSLLSKKQFTLIVVLLFFLQYGVQWYHCADGGPSLQKFLITYIIGMYLGKYPINFLVKHRFEFLFICSFLLIVLPYLVCLIGYSSLLKWVNTNFNPLCLFVCYGLVLVAISKPIVKKGNFITSNVLAVYLIHSSKFGNWFLWDSGIFDYTYFRILDLVLITTFVYISCVAIDVIRKKITDPFESYINKRISSIYDE